MATAAEDPLKHADVRSDDDEEEHAGAPLPAPSVLAPPRAPAMTLALIKPDAVAAGKADEILHIAELAGFTVVARRRMQLSPALAEAFYAEHRERPFFGALVAFMASGPVVAAALARRGAVGAWRALAGPTDATRARAAAPRSLRALYGTDGTRNAVHGSDAPASAARELRFFFPDLPLEAPPAAKPDATAAAEAVAPVVGEPADAVAAAAAAAAQGSSTGGGDGSGADGKAKGSEAEAFIAARLAPTLNKALTALAKAKPSSRGDEALLWLAAWLDDNNPRACRRVGPPAAAAASAAPAAPAPAFAAPRALPPPPPPVGPAEAAAAAAAHEAARAALEEDAAVKVQAAFRGHQARQSQVAAGPA